MRRICFIIPAIFLLAPFLYAQIPPFWNPYYMRLPANFRRDVEIQYRKTTKEEAEAIKPNEEDFRKYAEFLRQPDTGLTRLIPDQGCADYAKVVVATPVCLKYTMPGAGASFSFRVNDYRIPRLADLNYTKEGFQATGVLLHAIMTRIGDVPLENVTLQTKGLKYLVDFQPVTDFDQARKISDQLVKGIVKNGFIYRRGLNTVENTTYVLRSIAYNGESYRAVDNLTYNELDFDKRKDIIVAFRIVRKDADGSVTILWKQLVEKDAPKIKKKDK